MTTITRPPAPSLASLARHRMDALEGGPFILSDWAPAMFIHYQLDPRLLQPAVPFALDTRDGHAFVSLVAFRLARLQLNVGGRLVRPLGAGLANACFLNVRTYVCHEGEPGIFFMHEWISSAMQALIGPRAYGLPYHRAAVSLVERGDRMTARIATPDAGAELTIEARHGADAPAIAAPDSIEEFLCERYTAYTAASGIRRRFRIWHQPWRLTPADVTLGQAQLLDVTGTWRRHARQIGAATTAGVNDVWISKPSCIQGPACLTPWTEGVASVER